jgi:hypothetical protein
MHVSRIQFVVELLLLLMRAVGRLNKRPNGSSRARMARAKLDTGRELPVRGDQDLP